MGQRLNIEIWADENKRLANAYYHWSAYSKDSAELAAQIIKNIPLIKEQNYLLTAIRLLECTGALLTSDEIQYALEQRGLTEEKFMAAVSRNDGLIAISEQGMESTKMWQEGCIKIYLDKQKVSYDVFNKYDIEEYKAYIDENINISTLEKVNIDFKNIDFSEFDTLITFIEKYLGKYFLTNSDELIYSCIY